MRKITFDAVAAFYNEKPFKRGNTEVEVFICTLLRKTVYLILHGNTIARLKNGKLTISNGGWSSNTTKERLNAIFYRFFLSHEVKVFQKKGKLYVSVQNINVELDKENECTNQFVVYLIEPDKTYTLTETIDQKIVYLDEV